ncbi:hypothetical protein EVAR_59772_1 [Eumeta japonica]|uniref:Uncharacterized protein n=1 Tax=Eumeta variegata TaxID=151549 RepID=A0A4C1ZKQ6_EUMVA|nr:hypothetical protein EVAR_59772_1 [Eumeta japonica]
MASQLKCSKLTYCNGCTTYKMQWGGASDPSKSVVVASALNGRAGASTSEVHSDELHQFCRGNLTVSTSRHVYVSCFVHVLIRSAATAPVERSRRARVGHRRAAPLRPTASRSASLAALTIVPPRHDPPAPCGRRVAISPRCCEAFS